MTNLKTRLFAFSGLSHVRILRQAALAILPIVGMTPAIAQDCFVRVASDPAVERYDGDVVVRVKIKNAGDALAMSVISPDRWSCNSPGSNAEVDYRMKRSDLPLLDQTGIAYRIVIDNVQKLVDDERAELNAPFQDRSFFDNFQDGPAVNAYIATLAASYPEFVKPISLGVSLQFRQITGFRLTSPTPAIGGSPRKPVVLLNSAQHAREWITVMTNLYVATQFLENYQTDPSIRKILDTYEIVFIPVTNPDGYNISWTTSRLWRKNARVVQSSVAGVDNNRNWSVGWGLNSGSSSSAGSESYRGLAPFSEPENQAVANYVLRIPKLVAHIDIHSFAGLILRTWAYQTVKPVGIAGIDRVGNAMRIAINAVATQQYRYGGPELLYLSSGTAPDWTFGTTGSLGYTLELSSVNESFIPPASSIVPSGIEGLAGVVALITNLCTSDFNRDNLVDDADFQLFIAAYDILLSNEGDLTGDGMTDDSDFQLFSAAYDILTCP